MKLTKQRLLDTNIAQRDEKMRARYKDINYRCRREASKYCSEGCQSGTQNNFVATGTYLSYLSS
jgi:hypothetical protein